jgi:hypothetical protein
MDLNIFHNFIEKPIIIIYNYVMYYDSVNGGNTGRCKAFFEKLAYLRTENFMKS